MEEFDALADEVIACRCCPRLVAWRERVAFEKRAAFADQTYWGRAVPGFGDPAARFVIIGLAPAAHGANRTGRVFTGDRSGDFLFAALHRAGYANQARAVSIDDGLVLTDVFVTAPVKCAPPANQPTADERRACRPFLRRELALLDRAKVYLALGAIGYAAAAAELGLERPPRFAHGLEVALDRGRTLVCSYHVSQQNTFTGRLTTAMFDQLLARCVAISMVHH